jgi:hypothetical protein
MPWDMSPEAIELAVKAGHQQALETNKNNKDIKLKVNLSELRDLPLLGSKEQANMSPQQELKRLQQPIATMEWLTVELEDITVKDTCLIELENVQTLMQDFNKKLITGKEVNDRLVQHSGYLVLNPEQLTTLCALVPEHAREDVIFQDADGSNQLEEFDTFDPLLPLPQALEQYLLPFWDQKPVAVNIECDTLCATYNAHLSPGSIYHADMPRRKGNSIERAIATRLETLIRSGPKAPKVPYGQSEPKLQRDDSMHAIHPRHPTERPEDTPIQSKD